jgi:TolB-like protein/cytochrome c-type biogenesis protein CcmH/NrfG
MGFLRELQKRNVYKVGAAYTVVAWLLIEIADVILPTFNVPQWVQQALIVVLVLGLPVSLVLAWAYELTPQGLRRDAGDQHDAPDETDDGEPQAVLQASTKARLPDSIAVLPFDNLSPNPDDRFFAAGLHDEILNQLTKISALNVIARTSVLQYEGTRKPIAEIADELNVENVMEGSVRFANNRVRVTSQLIDAGIGSHLWSETYERPFDDIFAIESDIALNVARAMEAAFSRAEQKEIEHIPTTSSAAYGLYLQARQIVLTGAGKAERVHELLDQALRLDPNFARACGLKAMMYALLFVNTEQSVSAAAMDHETLENKVREWADRAFTIDPKDEDARTAIRTMSVLTWHWSDFEKNIEPGDENRLSSINLWFYSWNGQKDRAVEIGEKVVALDPNDASAHMSLAIVYAYAGKREASCRSFHRMIELSPEVVLGHHWLAFNEIALGNEEAALREMQLVEQLLGDDPRKIVFLPDLAYAYSRVGHHDDARRLVAEMEVLAGDKDLGAGTWVAAHLAMGDEKKALEKLEVLADKARNHETDAGFLNVMSLRMNHLADPTLEKPRFVDVFNRIVGD